MFQKNDSNKNRLDLIEPKFIEGLGRILTAGATKYEAHNWKTAEAKDTYRLKASLMRHIVSYLDGQRFDEETGESHLYHAAANLMFLDYFDRHQKIATGKDVSSLEREMYFFSTGMYSDDETIIKWLRGEDD